MLENKNGNTTQFGQFYGINIDPEKGTIGINPTIWFWCTIIRCETVSTQKF